MIHIDYRNLAKEPDNWGVLILPNLSLVHTYDGETAICIGWLIWYAEFWYFPK